MCTRRSARALLLAGFAMVALTAGQAGADPVTFSGTFGGAARFALVDQQLTLNFPTFSIALDVAPQLQPGMCRSGCDNGTGISFTQTTGVFSGHSPASPGAIDADVTGSLSFIGPTEFVSLTPDVGGDVLTAPVKLSGSLRVTQPGAVLFDGALMGSGTGTVVLETPLFGAQGTRLGGYEFVFSGVASTPEPSTIILLGTCASWLAVRRKWNGATSGRADRRIPTAAE